MTERFSARASVFESQLVRKFENDKEEARQTGFGGEPLLFSQITRVKNAVENDHCAWSTNPNGQTISTNNKHRKTCYSIIPFEQVGFCNWKSFYTSRNWEGLRNFVYTFVPQTAKTLFAQIEKKYGEETWWSDDIGKYIAKKFEAVHAAIFQWTHDPKTFNNIWDSSLQIPNVEFNMLDKLVGDETNQIQIYNDCISIPMRETDGYFDGHKYVYFSISILFVCCDYVYVFVYVIAIEKFQIAEDTMIVVHLNIVCIIQ